MCAQIEVVESELLMPEIEFVLTDTQQYGMIEFVLQMGGRFLVVPYGHTVPQFPVLESADEVLSYRGKATGPFNVISDLYTKNQTSSEDCRQYSFRADVYCYIKSVVGAGH